MGYSYADTDKTNDIKKKALELRKYCATTSCFRCCFNYGSIENPICLINKSPKYWRDEWSANEERNCSKCEKHMDLIDPRSGRWIGYFCSKKKEVTSHSKDNCKTACWDFEAYEENDN